MSTKVRYELAYNFIFEKQPPWKKKIAILFNVSSSNYGEKIKPNS